RLVRRCRVLCEDLTPDAQAELLIHLRACTAADLERALGAVDLARLCGDLARAGWEQDPPASLLTLLSAARVGELSPATRAALARGLMAGPSHRAEERALLAIFRGTPLEQLTAFKLALDAGYPDDLSSLVYDEVDDPALREALIERCRLAAGPGRIVLVDVDDTLFPFLNDSRYPDGRLYPGVRALLRALRAGQPTSVGLLTARPAPLGAYTVRGLAARGVPVTLALTGTLAGLRSHAAMAANKREAFARYRGLYPDLPALFCGDTGQGDAEVALALLADGALDLALLHDVVGLEPAARAALEAKGVVLFETYLGAALALEGAGWIDAEQLLRVTRFARAEWKAIPFAEDAPIQAVWARDLAAVEARLGRALGPGPR
ncbi:MAG: hypothetical protein KDD82_02195, partial [Planctomycetes bacterium]|nr:hypothetical protein [Planctomycetota bacterium]